MIMTNNISYPKLLKWFIREEWRLFTSLFGEKRFLLFPLIMFFFSIIIGAASPILNVSIEYLAMIYFSIIIVFGLQTGSIGFDAKDKLENLIGETSRILYSSKTLPIKKRTLVSLFLLKDGIFYSFIFLAPITLGVIVGLFISPIESTSLMNVLSVYSIPILYITTIISFIFGVSIGFTITTIRMGRISGIVVLSSLIAILYTFLSYDLLSFRYIVRISLFNWMVGLSVSSVVFIIMGLIQFKNPDRISNKQIFKNRYRKLDELFTSNYNSTKIMLKSLIDIQRSSGGFLKIIFSISLIVFISFLLMKFMSDFFGLAPIPTYIYAGLFSLMAYPLYTICFKYDSLDTYSALPISHTDIYEAKVLLFTVIGVPLGVIFYTPFILYDATVIEYIQGLIVFISLLYYQLGLLMHISGDNPVQFLFDGVLFTIYSLSILIFIIPILVIGMYGILFPSIMSTMILLYGILAGVIGSVLIYIKFKKI